MDNIFRVIKPESIGIPSEAIIKFIDQLEGNDVNIHSFLMAKDNKIFAEAYWKPFNENFQHRMYSIGKSFTSIAIGLLQEEGKLNINDYICNYFSDKLPKEGVHEYIKQMTIKDMLTMRSAHNKTTYKQEDNPDWVGSFFRVKPTQYPGTIFSYDTSSTLVLAALVEKLSKKTLMDYLREKLLDYIGVSEKAKFLLDPMGISQGGSGLICTMRDLAKFAYVCMNEGYYNGMQLIPKDYLQEATMKQVDTFAQQVIDEQQGYGYQIWKSRHNGFTLYGMGGQLSICIPKYKIMLITTADTQGNPTGVQCIYDAFWQQIYPHISKGDNSIPENTKSFNKLNEKINNLTLKPIKGQISTSYTNIINRKKYLLEDNLMDIESFKIIIKGEDGLIEYSNSNGEFTIPFSFGKLTKFKEKTLCIPMLSSAAWSSENILCLQVNLIGEQLGCIKVNFGFNKKNVTILIKKYVEGILNNYDGIAVGTIQE